MSDPIVDRMEQPDRVKWEFLRAEAYKLLREAHEIYMAYANQHDESSSGRSHISASPSIHSG